jgi:DNA-binding MarR family transcriptional regulator
MVDGWHINYSPFETETPSRMSGEIAFCEALRKTIARLDCGDRQLLNRFSLTTPRYYALKRIYENPGVSLTTLSALMLVDKSCATRLIRTMEQEGLVRRVRSESDRRTYWLDLTESGRKLYRSASAAHDRYAQKRFSEIDIDVEALVGDLEMLADSLGREAKRVELRR